MQKKKTKQKKQISQKKINLCLFNVRMCLLPSTKGEKATYTMRTPCAMTEIIPVIIVKMLHHCVKNIFEI